VRSPFLLQTDLYAGRAHSPRTIKGSDFAWAQEKGTARRAFFSVEDTATCDGMCGGYEKSVCRNLQWMIQAQLKYGAFVELQVMTGQKAGERA
jgi:hypothetical protein